jgi:RHS repeat-associated protein
VDQNGSLLAKYAQGQNIDEPLAESVGGATYDYEQDGLGSVTSLTNTSGTVAQSYTFDSFGDTTNSSGSIANPFRYTGRDFDSETGLYYYRARYYDPTDGRFVNEDPLRFAEGESFYLYVRGNPTNLVDPTGLFGTGDIWRAMRHYCGGSGTPWTANFGSINWGSLQGDEIAKVKSMVGGSCTERTTPLFFTMPAQTEGADKWIIGRHSAFVSGQLRVHCDCSWEFNGDLSSAQGYDTYQFYPSNRGLIGETATWFGEHACNGKPFRIYLPGRTAGDVSGKIAGTPTCNCKHK